MRAQRRDFCCVARRRYALAWVLLVAAVALNSAAPNAAAALLESNTELATAGFYRLSWAAAEQVDAQAEAQFELQEASDPSFADARSLYRGPDLATVLSGRADGQYFYRVRTTGAAGAQQWSEIVRVNVAHHPLGRAFAFFAAGAIVFLATLGLIIVGTRQSRGGHD